MCATGNGLGCTTGEGGNIVPLEMLMKNGPVYFVVGTGFIYYVYLQRQDDVMVYGLVTDFFHCQCWYTVF